MQNFYYQNIFTNNLHFSFMTMLIGVLFLFGEIPAVCQNLNEFYVLEHDRKTPNEVVNRPQVKFHYVI